MENFITCAHCGGAVADTDICPCTPELKPKRARARFIPLRFTCEQIEPMIHDMGGFCLACGREAYNIEPDAARYPCEECGKHQVYGAQEILIMGLVD